MEISILEECGYKWAIRGFGYSFKDRAIHPDDFYTEERFNGIEKAALVHAGRGNGMDKWLRQVVVFVDVEAPRYFWSEFDTYKVGTVAQSESTMHTLGSRHPEEYDFSWIDDDVYQTLTNNWPHTNSEIVKFKSMIPESYLQRRLVTLNYQVLRTIIAQRKTHRLPEWRVFIEALYSQCEHPELLPEYPYGI